MNKGSNYNLDITESLGWWDLDIENYGEWAYELDLKVVGDTVFSRYRDRVSNKTILYLKEWIISLYIIY